jgi:two-component system, LuxR family, sensor kinase FixL
MGHRYGRAGAMPLAFVMDVKNSFISMAARWRGSPVDARADGDLLKQRQQVHLTRVAVLGQLSGALAHELQQPLTSILCNARAAQHMLAMRDWKVEQLSEILADIVSEDKRAGEVIRRMRALLIRGETQTQPVVVDELIADVIAIARTTFVKRGVQLSTCIDKGLPPVQGDPVELQQVLLNLMLNACESMGMNAPAKRQIEVTAGMDTDRGAVRFTVLDRGAGIPSAQLEHIFDPFFTTKESGLGLGLAICRAIVVAHKGRLWATNRLDRGAAFNFTVPLTSPSGAV